MQYIKNTSPTGETQWAIAVPGHGMVLASEATLGDRLVARIVDGSATPEEVVRGASIGLRLEAEFNAVSERVQYRDGHILFDGDIVDRSITHHMVERLTTGDPSWKSLVLFMDKLGGNPSKRSRNQFYDFVLRHGLTITAQGDVVMYKGLTEEMTSVHSGPGVVVTPDGVRTVYEEDLCRNTPAPNTRSTT